MDDSSLFFTLGAFVFGCLLTSFFYKKNQGNNSVDIYQKKMELALAPIVNKVTDLSNLFNDSVKLGKAIERPLENWLVSAGYVKGKQFDTQVSTEDGIPDLVFYNAYGDKKLVIDSKLSTTNYLKLKKELDDENVKEAENYHKAFGIDVKKQIDKCKKYLNIEDSFDLVIMYIGIDSIFQYVIDNKFYESPSATSKTFDLQEYAEKNQVIIVNASSLFVILEHIDIVKENFKIIEAQKELKKLHKELIDSWEKWSSKTDKFEASVNKVVTEITKETTGGVLYELKQYNNKRKQALDNKIGEMKKLLEKDPES